MRTEFINNYKRYDAFYCLTWYTEEYSHIELLSKRFFFFFISVLGITPSLYKRARFVTPALLLALFLNVRHNSSKQKKRNEKESKKEKKQQSTCRVSAMYSSHQKNQFEQFLGR